MFYSSEETEFLMPIKQKQMIYLPTLMQILAVAIDSGSDLKVLTI